MTEQIFTKTKTVRFILLISIFVISACAGEGVEKGLRMVTANGNDFAWSPDGERIAFTSDKDGQFDVYIMDSDGGNIVRVADTAGILASYKPAWSPDGNYIAFNVQLERNDIVVVRLEEFADGPLDAFDVSFRGLEGAGMSEHTFDRDNRNPDWSPNGEKIAFHAHIAENTEIYIMDADGKNGVAIEGQEGDNLTPKWSPDGSRIAFTSDRAGQHDIYVMDVDGTNIVRLTNHPAADWTPDWSPDGEWIVFESKRTENWDLFALHLERNDLVQLTFDETDDVSADWSPDGSLIGFTSLRSGEAALFVIDAPE